MPFSLILVAVVFGLLISALLHFVLIWPGQEPLEPDQASADGGAAGDVGDGGDSRG